MLLGARALPLDTCRTLPLAAYLRGEGVPLVPCVVAVVGVAFGSVATVSVLKHGYSGHG